MTELAASDWLGFRTIFYNEKTLKYSTKINEVIDYNDIQIHKEGLAAYMDFGYSVFGYTPVMHIKYLLPYQKLYLDNGQFKVTNEEDLTLSKIGHESNENDVLDKFQSHIRTWENTISGDIIIPTSGGFDSRLLNFFVHDKGRIKAFTYGISKKQEDSREAVYAKELCKRLHIDWDRIELGKFNQYEEEWYNQFGPAVAATGTYHIEFYNKIKNRVGADNHHLLSGIIGDAWAGSVNTAPVTDVQEYINLGYTHGMTADARRAIHADYKSIAEPIYERQKNALQDNLFRVVTAMRTKIMLLQYLITVPEQIGFKGYSPFLDEDIAMSMLNLPAERRFQRAWQRDFFRKNNILFEEEKHQFTYQNSLNYSAIINEKLAPLNVKLLSDYIDKKYLNWINSKLSHIGIRERMFQTLMHTPKVKGAMKMMGFKNDLLSAYFAYVTIRPIELLLNNQKGKG